MLTSKSSRFCASLDLLFMAKEGADSARVTFRVSSTSRRNRATAFEFSKVSREWSLDQLVPLTQGRGLHTVRPMPPLAINGVILNLFANTLSDRNQEGPGNPTFRLSLKSASAGNYGLIRALEAGFEVG